MARIENESRNVDQRDEEEKEEIDEVGSSSSTEGVQDESMMSKDHNLRLGHVSKESNSDLPEESKYGFGTTDKVQQFYEELCQKLKEQYPDKYENEMNIDK